MNCALKTRAKLSQAEVIAIFQFKKVYPKSSAAKIAKLYRISEKAVRDIWTGRTWTNETWHLDTSRILCQRNIGRPKGCRDSKPRVSTRGKDSKESLSCKVSKNAFAESKSDTIERWRNDVSTTASTIYSETMLINMQSDSHGPLNALSTSPLQTTSSASGSVDQQLYEWDRAFWIEHESGDPFHGDWRLRKEGA